MERQGDPERYERLIKDRIEFSVQTLEGKELTLKDKKKTVEEQNMLTEQLVMGHEAAQMFNWFELDKLIWKDHRQVHHMSALL